MIEQTSKKVARIAGKLLEIKMSRDDKALFRLQNGFPWSDIRSIAASCLNQAPNRSKRIPKAKGRAKR